MTAYIKAISKRSEGEDKEKTLPIAHLGSSMVNHGEEFDTNSQFGQCLICEYRLQHPNYPNIVRCSSWDYSMWKSPRTSGADAGELRYASDIELA